VKLDGQPLIDAEVIFRPEFGRPSLGRTNAEGKYVLMYSREEAGAVPGAHRVSISTRIDADESSSDPLLKQGRSESVPEKYNTQTTLQADVSLGKKSELNFDLVSK
jgi:hypothetical protein